MKKSEWSDKQLEELLRQMPKIKDHRHPRDIYQNLSLKKRQRTSLLVPGLAAVAVLLLLFILVPNLLDGVQYSFNRPNEEKSSADKMKDDSMNHKDSSIAMVQRNRSYDKKEQDGAVPKMLEVDNEKTALYEEEVGKRNVLTYWFPDKEAQFLIPVSTLVENTANKKWITLFEEEMDVLKEKEKDWGLSDFYPVKADFKLDIDNSIIVDVPEDHQYGNGSANELSFLNVLKKNVSTNSTVRKIKFQTNGRPGIQLGNIGIKNEEDIEVDNHHAYFFYYPKGSQIPFLVPSNEKFKDISTAFSAMEKDNLNGQLKASLNLFRFTQAVIKEETLFLVVNPKTKLENNIPTLHSFEAILLTAKDFGADTVRIENSPIASLGPFDLSKEVKVPVAPNFRVTQ